MTTKDNLESVAGVVAAAALGFGGQQRRPEPVVARAGQAADPAAGAGVGAVWTILSTDMAATSSVVRHRQAYAERNAATAYRRARR